MNCNTANSGFSAETEQWIGPEAQYGLTDSPYAITRRPVPTQGARDIALPEQVVIDATTWNAPSYSTQRVLLPERSHLPSIDINTYMVDIMLDPGGRVIPTTVYSSPANFGAAPFYHFWLAERQDVHQPLWGISNSGLPNLNPGEPNYQYFLPMPQGTLNYTDNANGAATTLFLKGERRLITLNAQTGQMTINEVEVFNAADTQYPFYQPQQGARTTQ